MGGLRAGIVILGLNRSFALTTLTLLVPLTERWSLRWPAWTIDALVLAALAARVFWAVERRVEGNGRTPLPPPSLVRQPGMRGGLLLALSFFAGFGAFTFCYALLVQDGRSASALTAGLGPAPMAEVFLLASLSTAAAGQVRAEGARLTTTQQTALALGVATLGSLFLALAGDATGVRTAFVVVLAVQVLIAVAVAAGARDCPRAGAGRDLQESRRLLRTGWCRTLLSGHAYPVRAARSSPS